MALGQARVARLRFDGRAFQNKKFAHYARHALSSIGELAQKRVGQASFARHAGKESLWAYGFG